MPGDSSIAWTGKSWNVAVVGCDETNEGCDNCYARELHNKWYRVAASGGKVTAREYMAPFSPARRMVEIFGEEKYGKRLHWPLHVRKPDKIFVNSMTDLYHSVARDEDIADVFAIMARANWHTYQILTKRYGRLRRLGPLLRWQPHIWQGISIAMNKYLPAVSALSAGAAEAGVRFLSLEPLLDDLVDLTPALLRQHRIDWVIAGAESGPFHRPMSLDWVRRIRDACVAADVAFFLKQTVDERGRKTQLPALDDTVWAEYPDVA